jgi:hypothetical protein
MFLIFALIIAGVTYEVTSKDVPAQKLEQLEQHRSECPLNSEKGR